MKGSFSWLMTVLVGAGMSSVAFGQDGGSTMSGFAALGPALAIGLAAMGAAFAQGKVGSAAVEGIARNPNAKGEVFTPFVLALALIEFQAILGFIIAFLLQGKL